MKFISKLIINMMVRLVFLAVVFFTFSSSIPALCEDPATQVTTIEDDFAQGAKHYLAKEYSLAAESFKRAAAKKATTDIYLNLGLAEFQLGHFGWALANWRKALDLSPWNSSAKEAIEHLYSINKLRRGTEDNSIIQKIHGSVLRYIPLPVFLLLALVLMFSGAWKLFSFIGDRRRANLSGEIPPSFPIKVGALLILFILTVLITGIKQFDLRTIRATITAQSSPLRTGPTEESANVMEIFEGQEVIVQRLDKDWLQVTYAGKTTGWIDRKSAELTSGE